MRLQVLAVLGHELGHVAHRHMLRHIAEALGLGAATALVWDEREADAIAVRFLQQSGLGFEPLVEIFETLQGIQSRRSMNIPELLSTHPPTPERLERFR
jgi:predicted Zn-dependent protease